MSDINIKTFTLDWNCILAVDEDRQPQAQCLKALLEAHSQGKISVNVSAVSFAENCRKGDAGYFDFAAFRVRLAKLGFPTERFALAPARIGRSPIGNCYFQGSGANDLVGNIRAILFPKSQKMWRDQRATIEALNPEAEEKSLRKWNNQQCDCEVLASHIRAKHDVFVTSDIKEFQANEVELKKIGANCFMTPCEVVTVFL